jgi:putative membrane protein
MVAFTLTLVVAVVWALVAATRPSGTSAPSDRRTAEEILNERFARGEVDAVEYRERRDVLRGHSPAAND